jgi:predicted flap endonuclease-1-like 5' DNA nuclease
MAKLETIEGIGPYFAERLRAAGVSTVEALLRAGATPGGRRQLEAKTGIGHESILDWVNRADLMRVRGVGEEYSDLLEKGGEDTAAELAQRNPDYLHAKMVAANRSMYLVRRMPTRAMVADWIAQAKTLPRVVSH